MSDYGEWTVEDLDAYRTEMQADLLQLNRERDRLEFTLKLVTMEWERKMRRT